MVIEANGETVNFPQGLAVNVVQYMDTIDIRIDAGNPFDRVTERIDVGWIPIGLDTLAESLDWDLRECTVGEALVRAGYAEDEIEAISEGTLEALEAHALGLGIGVTEIALVDFSGYKWDTPERKIFDEFVMLVYDRIAGDFDDLEFTERLAQELKGLSLSELLEEIGAAVESVAESYVYELANYFIESDYPIEVISGEEEEEE
jgi:hypothetical protein